MPSRTLPLLLLLILVPVLFGIGGSIHVLAHHDGTDTDSRNCEICYLLTVVTTSAITAAVLLLRHYDGEPKLLLVTSLRPTRRDEAPAVSARAPPLH